MISMQIPVMLLGIGLLALVLLDAFQTIILPPPPGRPLPHHTAVLPRHLVPVDNARQHPARPTQSRTALQRLRPSRTAGALYRLGDPCLPSPIGLIYLGLKAPFSDPLHPVTFWQLLRSCLYISGTTIFTLGLGDVQPIGYIARTLIVLEAGTGLGFVALVIGYVPVLYTAFSNREISVALLDARAGSPPTSGELLTRHNFSGGHEALIALLSEWERWSAGLLETHISYPILCYYRSQHDNQSWLAAITAVLDTCALLITTIEGPSTRQAQLTFAIARHVLVDIGHVFRLESKEQAIRDRPSTRLEDDHFGELCDLLGDAGFWPLHQSGYPGAPRRNPQAV